MLTFKIMLRNALPEHQLSVAALMPVCDDWTSAAELIRLLDETLSSHPYVLEVLLVDDGSIQDWRSTTFPSRLTAIRTIRTLRLRRNLGHQRAISIWLAYIAENVSCDAVLIMDADGEDTPDGALRLLQVFSDDGGSRAVFAARSRRSESLTFRCSYTVYKALHWILTGLSVKVGNFSIIPSGYLKTLATISDLWNHYAAAVFRSRLPFTTTPIPRGRRIAGSSRMNFVALVVHGLSAISVFGDIVGVRLLIASIAGSCLTILGLLIVVSLRLFTDRAIPGWATYASGTLAVIAIQFITMATSFTFFVLTNRATLGYVPVRDHAMFIADCVDIYRHV